MSEENKRLWQQVKEAQRDMETWPAWMKSGNKFVGSERRPYHSSRSKTE